MKTKLPVRQVCLGVGCLLMLTAGSVPVSAQIVVKNEDVTFKFGVQGQLWADWTQDSSGTPRAINRTSTCAARASSSAAISARTSSFFIETDDPKLGITPKNLAGGIHPPGRLDRVEAHQGSSRWMAVCYIVPFTPQRAAIDVELPDAGRQPDRDGEQRRHAIVRPCATWAFSSRASSPTSACSTAIGAFDGNATPTGTIRCGPPATCNTISSTARQGYLFSGTALGKQKILAVDAGFDRQGSYRGYSANRRRRFP